MANKQTGNTNAFNANVQDSVMLAASGEMLLMLVKKYQDAVKRGDPQEVISLINGLKVQIYTTSQWTKQIAPEIVNGTSHLLEGDPSEYSPTA